MMKERNEKKRINKDPSPKCLNLFIFYDVGDFAKIPPCGKTKSLSWHKHHLIGSLAFQEKRQISFVFGGMVLPSQLFF